MNAASSILGDFKTGVSISSGSWFTAVCVAGTSSMQEPAAAMQRTRAVFEHAVIDMQTNLDTYLRCVLSHCV